MDARLDLNWEEVSILRSALRAHVRIWNPSRNVGASNAKFARGEVRGAIALDRRLALSSARIKAANLGQPQPASFHEVRAARLSARKRQVLKVAA